MSAHCNQKIDWEIAALDGELFPRAARLSSIPLITVPMEWTSEIEEPVAARDGAVVPRRPRCDAVTLASMKLERRPWELSSFRLVPFLTAGLTAGILLGSICALAFSPTRAEPPRIAMVAPAANPQGAPAAGPALPGGLTPESEDSVIDASVDAVPVTAPAAVTEVAAPRPQAQTITAAVMYRNDRASKPSTLESLAPRSADIDRSAAAVALAVAGRRAAACLSPNDARGSMPVSVTFAASGRVTTARIDGGPFAGTETGGCIARTLRSAKVGAFEGAPVTIHGSVHLR